jgi:hypothetical protein
VNVQNSRQTMPSEHRRHDRLLVTRFAMDDAYPSETAEARQLIESCSECASLAADIRALSSSMAQLRAAKRTQDFTITAEKAEELRGSRISRWMRGLAAPSFGMLRPVAGVALSIGLVMVVVGAAMPSNSPTGETLFNAGAHSAATDKAVPPPQAAPGAGAPETAAPEPVDPGPVAGAASTEAPEVQALASPLDGVRNESPAEALAQSSPDSQTDQLDSAYVKPSPDADVTPPQGDEFVAARPADNTRDLLFYAGLAIAGLSVLLLALAWFARHYFADPLLR